MSKRNYFGPPFEELPEAKAADYRGRYLKRNEIKTRQCVYISREIHNKISKIVNILATEQGISIGVILTQYSLNTSKSIGTQSTPCIRNSKKI